MMDKNDPASGLTEHVARKFEAEMQVFEAKESQTSATKVAQPDPTNIALQAGLLPMPDSQGNRHPHSHLPGVPLNERHMVVLKNANVLEKDVMLGKNRHRLTFEIFIYTSRKIFQVELIKGNCY